MASKTILGLDLGTNSIGWALVKQDFEQKSGEILGMGTRIIPMSQEIIGKFAEGSKISQTAERTGYRGVRRLTERHLLRRERLHRVLNVLGFLPKHFADQIDFDKRLGQFLPGLEPKLVYHNNKFIFKSSFLEMMEDFSKTQPSLLKNESGESKLLPYDWTIFYLRKKALTQKIEKEELAWLLLNFNQKRGYYQLRGEEEEENPNKLVEYHSLKIVEVKEDEAQKGKAEIWYSLILENGWIYRRSSKTPLFDMAGKTRDFIVTTDINDDGSIKVDSEGKEKRSFRAPKDDDWTLMKKKTEADIAKSKKTVGTYIYENLLLDPKQKIKGKLIKTIERHFYKSELKLILETQQKFHSELGNEGLLADCVRELYRHNESHQNTLLAKDFTHLFLNDIIFYQRPLKSQKSSITNCAFEQRVFKLADGTKKIEPLKAIPKSNPLYQEFRIWQWIYNLSIHLRDDDSNVSHLFLNLVGDFENLFEFLNDRKEVTQDALLKFFIGKNGLKGKELTKEVAKYRWNFIDDKEKKYPCNETRAVINSRLAKVKGINEDFLNPEIEYALWHIIYSVTDKHEYEKALLSFAKKHQLDEESFKDNFKKMPPFNADYGSYSSKAIKKLLALMRIGKYWSWEAISPKAQERINKIITGEFDENIKDRVREKAINLIDNDHFQGLQLWLASYIVYGRHSESSGQGQWKNVTDLEQYLQEFRQHSLKNPIVEQVITETLRVVKDIWQNEEFGKGAVSYFDEIHIELGREMKNTAEDRKRLTKIGTDNENTNLRIKALLVELQKDSNIENVRPYSPSQQEILKIYEDGVLSSEFEIPEDIAKISVSAQPSGADLLKYKLWLAQRYRSPYTGKTIPLAKLFTSAYEIEHIIPQSRYFDDSFSNKVICESAVNKLKDSQIGLEFIKNHHGEIVSLGFGENVKVFEVDEYESFVKEQYAKGSSRAKRNKLLMEEVPEKMVERQLNDTRYISKFISSILSNIVRSNTNDDGVNSKNILPGNGKVTGILKQDWGLNDVWNDLILPRFERMNQIKQTTAFTTYNQNHQKFLPTVPLEFSKGFQKKRIDHRHHALDALIIACLTRNHINYLNNQNAIEKGKSKSEKEKSRIDLKHLLCDKTKPDANGNYQWVFKKPWANYTQDARLNLEGIIVSFKQNQRVINKTLNKYESYKDENGNLRIGKDGKLHKEYIKQTQGINWAIRKPMHQETVAGAIVLSSEKTVNFKFALESPELIIDRSLRKKVKQLIKEGLNNTEIYSFFKKLEFQWKEKDISKVLIRVWEKDAEGLGLNAASRVSLDDSFDQKKILTITDTGIQKILLKHLANYEGKLDSFGKAIEPHLLAFSAEGIEALNKNIANLNDGKYHQPIKKVRTFEPLGNKFRVGNSGNKKDKYVIAAKGTNLFFAVYWDEEKKKRVFDTIPLNEVIEHQKWRAGLTDIEKQKMPMVPIKPTLGTYLFCLSPNDLVYVPEETNVDKLEPMAIYKVVSFSGNQCFFLRNDIATSIINAEEFSVKNKLERNFEGKMIKETCQKVNLNRLGQF